MTDTARALCAFFGSFGVPAYAEDDVPDRALPPYITVEVLEPTWDASAPFHVRVWDRHHSYARAMAIADAVGRAVGAGICLRLTDGAAWIHRGNTFAQRIPAHGDPVLKTIYLSMTLQVVREE